MDGDQSLDDLALIAATTFATPIAIICIAGGRRHWFQAEKDLGVATMPNGGLCQLVREKQAPVVVRDLISPEWSGPRATLSGIRFYAGVPLVAGAGATLGTLCVEDYRPREFSPQDLAALEALARQVVTAIERDDRHNGPGVSPVAGGDNNKEQPHQRVQSQTLQAVGQLASGIAHEFNNILAVVIGQLSVLEMEFDAADPRRGDIRRIAESAERAAALTRQLMAFSRHQRSSVQVVDLNLLIAQHERTLRRLAGDQVALSVSLSDAPCPVHIDPAHVEQILVNLTLNARDAMAAGGTLRIETSTTGVEGQPGSGWDALEPGGCVALTVGDTGHGMSAEVKSRIFEPFFTTKDVGKGTGLGLSTVYGIVAQCGGQIQVQSQPGAGTTFTLLLPLVPVTRLHSPPTAWPHVTPRGSETILIVESDTGLRDLTTSILRRHGYWVLEAASGHDAIALSARQPGPLHLLVVSTVGTVSTGGTGSTGAGLARRLLSTRPNTRVLYVTGHMQHRESFGPGPHSDVIEKPFTSASLLAAVRRLLDRGTTQSSASS